MLTFHIVTLFPEFFETPLRTGLLKRAVDRGIINFSFHNPRDYGLGPHKQVDDKPFGGGPGMLMRIEPMACAIHSIKKPGIILALAAAGRQFNQAMAEELAGTENITLVCGRYEGIDQRLKEIYPVHEISLCPAVLNGGEAAALAIIEAVGRLEKGFMGKDESSRIESFHDNLLEFPQYTRPEEYKGHRVPDVLLGGNHAEIAKWRRAEALARTLAARPELLANAKLDKTDADGLARVSRERIGRNLSFCLCHYPVWTDGEKSGCSSLTNLDIHDIGRISRCYGLGPFFVLHPLDDQRKILNEILSHWLTRSGGYEDRKKALNLVHAVQNFEEISKFFMQYHGQEPYWFVSSASWPEKNGECVSISEARKICGQGPAVICLGTARGLDVNKLPFKFMRLAPIRFLDENHLPVRAAAAIMADRILGDFY